MTDAAADPRLCLFGETGAGWPGPHHCRQCAALVDEMQRRFDAKVRAGEYTERGDVKRETRLGRAAIHGR